MYTMFSQFPGCEKQLIIVKIIVQVMLSQSSLPFWVIISY